MKKITLFVLAVFMTTGLFAVPKIIYVTPDGSSSDTFDGLSWDYPVSLSRGRALANFYNTKAVPEENQIWMKAGTYDISTSFQTNIKITIYGGFAGNETSLSERNWYVNKTIINQTGAAMVIWGNTQDDVLLDGLILQGGRPVGANGCGQIAQGTTLRNCIIRNNKASGNVGALGFAAVSGSTKKITLDNCLIINNEAGGNTCAIGAGAIPADIINCTITNNLANTGTIAAISNTGLLNIYNSIIYGNKNLSASAKSVGDNTNKTLINNAWDVAATNGNLTNNILLSGTPFLSATTFAGAANGTTQLASAIENGNFKLSGSYCVNNGNNSYATATTDLSGVSRKMGTVDIGCFEYGAPELPVSVTATAGNAKAIVGFTTPVSDGGSAIIDYTVTSVPGGITATASSGPIIITGLSNGTAYGFTVSARNANGTGVKSGQSAVVTPDATNYIISVSANSNISSHSITAISDLNVNSGAELTINAPAKVNSITVAPGAKLTLTEGNSLTAAALNLKSDATGIATLVDNTLTSPQTVSATVDQYFGAARNWYASPAVSGTKVPAGQTYYTYDEKGANTGFTAPATAYWCAVGENQNISPETAYIIPVSGPETLTSTGTLVTGGVQVPLTRRGAEKPGFNLVANPYLSYLDWSMVDTTAAKIMSTVWYRTKTSLNDYTFDTYNGKLDVATNNGAVTVTGLIPPKQAFWVRVKPGETDGTLTFTNAMRKHADNSSNLLKAPSTKNSIKQILRLRITGGTHSDETVICFHPEASDNFDAFDSQKMSNANSVIPEIYSLAGVEQLVINGLSNSASDKEIRLGITIGTAGEYSLKANELSGFSTGQHVYLIDKELNKEVELTSDEVYGFYSTAVANNESRFSLLFKTASVSTGTEKIISGSYAYLNASHQIVILAPANSVYEIFNSSGQKISEGKVTNQNTIVNSTYTNGLYIVRITGNGEQYNHKVIIN